MNNKIGIIDLGSNTARLVIVKLLGDGHFIVIDQIKERVRLGKDMEKDGFLKPTQIEEAMRESIAKIVDIVKVTLEKTPPELAADISDKGIYMTGGGCLVDGLDRLLQEKTGINVMIANDTVSCVALGTGKALDNLDVLDGKIRR